MSGAPALPYQNVSVNFEVEITGNSELSIFGLPAPSVSNVIVADMALPVNCLYDERVPGSKKGLIEFWEPAAGPELNAIAQATDAMGHSGASFALCMRHMECIAKEGWIDYCRTHIYPQFTK